MPGDGLRAWSALPAAEQYVLRLAWEACVAGTVGVGAVILDDRGEVVAAARNSTRGRPAEGQPLSGTYMAHAEINALAQVPTGRNLECCVLLTTLTPCIMCAGAAVMAHVGRIRFLARDPIFPIGFSPEEMDEFVQRQWPHYETREEDEWSVLALLLAGNAKTISKPDGIVARTLDQREPELAALLRWAVAEKVLQTSDHEGASVETVVDRVWPVLRQVSHARRARAAQGAL